MCQAAVSLISKALHEVDNAELLLKIKGVIALFIQTMGVSRSSRFPGMTTDNLVMELPCEVTRFLSFDLIREVRRAAEA